MRTGMTGPTTHLPEMIHALHQPLHHARAVWRVYMALKSLGFNTMFENLLLSSSREQFHEVTVHLKGGMYAMWIGAKKNVGCGTRWVASQLIYIIAGKRMNERLQHVHCSCTVHMLCVIRSVTVVTSSCMFAYYRYRPKYDIFCIECHALCTNAKINIIVISTRVYGTVGLAERPLLLCLFQRYAGDGTCTQQLQCDRHLRAVTYIPICTESDANALVTLREGSSHWRPCVHMRSSV